MVDEVDKIKDVNAISTGSRLELIYEVAVIVAIDVIDELVEFDEVN